MVPGTPAQARWVQLQPRRILPAALAERIVRTELPRARVASFELIESGLRNSNFRIDLDAPPHRLVLRVYEQDISLCAKELDLLRLVRGTVPVPEVIHAAPEGWEELPPFILMGYVEGVEFRDLARSGEADAVAQAARSAGEALAAIGRFTFLKSGWIAPGPTVSAPLLEGADPVPRFVDLCLAAERLQRRMPAELRERTHAMMWKQAPRLAELDGETSLVHGDFNRGNLLVKPAGGKWAVAAVLDWEFAVSASPLNDIGNFLRYERASRPTAEPHFSRGYRDGGGTLADDWRNLAKWLSLSACCEALTRELPAAVGSELIELVRAAVEDRDPEL
jgi:aminoglycoside phosphotransferase (APT) family kinase protein